MCIQIEKTPLVSMVCTIILQRCKGQHGRYTLHDYASNDRDGLRMTSSVQLRNYLYWKK